MNPYGKPRHGPADDPPRRSVAAGLYHALTKLGRDPLHRAADMDDTGQARIAHLNRLGLVRFAAEPVADYCRYALLQVQPRSLEAMESTKRTSSIYRSICLSVLGNSSAPAVSTSPAT